MKQCRGTRQATSWPQIETQRGKEERKQLRQKQDGEMARTRVSAKACRKRVVPNRRGEGSIPHGGMGAKHQDVYLAARCLIGGETNSRLSGKEQHCNNGPMKQQRRRRGCSPTATHPMHGVGSYRGRGKLCSRQPSAGKVPRQLTLVGYARGPHVLGRQTAGLCTHWTVRVTTN